MYFTFEISRPICWRPSFYRSRLTTFSLTWLFFGISLHPMRQDEMHDLIRSGLTKWGGT